VLVVFWLKAFDKILSFTIFLDCIGMAASAGTIFKLRKQNVFPEGKEFYRMGLYPFLPLIFIAAYIFVATSIAIDTPWTAVTALAVMTGFMVIYFISKKPRA
jgi:APA family basic amino acid/polyamine antiporter